MLQRNNFLKQHHALITVFRLLYRSKFQIFCRELNIMIKVVRYLPKSEAAIHKCLQSVTEKGLFMSISFTKVAVLQPEKRPHQRFFPVVYVIFQKSFLAKHIWVVPASAKYHLVSQLHRPHQQAQPAWMRLWEVSYSISKTSQRMLICKYLRRLPGD